MARTFKLTKSGTYYYRRRTLPTVEVAEDGSQIVGSEAECLKTRWGFQRSKVSQGNRCLLPPADWNLVQD